MNKEASGCVSFSICFSGHIDKAALVKIVLLQSVLDVGIPTLLAEGVYILLA